MWQLGLILLFVIEISGNRFADTKQFAPLSDELIDFINHKSGASWKASRSDRFKSVDDARMLLGVLKNPKQDEKTSGRLTMVHDLKGEQLPKSFDARDEWPNCTTIGQIRDQAACGSCWAFGAVEAMSDRLCIHSAGKINVDISARDLMACCFECGDGCYGGNLMPSWEYWVYFGIVTGGGYNSNDGCLSYPFPKCEHHSHGQLPDCPHDLYPNPECVDKCDAGFNKSYTESKTFGKSAYSLLENEDQIMKEIMTNGPVEAAFDVYEDFLNYKSGVYSHQTGSELAGHAIKILGWGEESSVKYWLAANSWNSDWGEKGYFRILRGVDECSIESDVVAGLPKVA